MPRVQRAHPTGQFPVWMTAGLVLITHLLVYRILPNLTALLVPGGARIMIPTTDGRFTLSELIGSYLLFTALLLLVSGGPRGAGLIVRSADLPLLRLGLGLQLVISPLIMLAQGQVGAVWAQAMGVVSGRDYLVYCTWTAWVMAAFREELYFRGFVQGAVHRVLPGIWSLLVPALYFGAVHLGNPGPLALRMTWALSTVLPGLLFGAMYRLSGSLLPSIVAHGTGNLVMTGLTGLYLFLRPFWLPAIAVSVIVGVALLWNERHRTAAWARSLWAETLRSFLPEAGRGLLLTLLLVAWYLVVNWYIPLATP